MKYTKEDVLRVAKDLYFYPTKEEIQEVINRLDEEAENDPTGNLELWIENLLYSIEVKQIVPPKYDNSNPKPTENDQQLIDAVIERIKKDVKVGDFTAIEELLFFIPIEYLKGYLPEEGL